MKNEQWIRVKDLFAKVQQLPQQERRNFVHNHCADPVVRLEVESLICEYEQDEFDDFPPLKRFVPRRRLGSGVFGTVFEAYDAEQEIVLAVKVLRRSDASALERFKREFWTLRELDHPNLVKLYQLFNEEDSWFFSMQLIRGVSFLDYVQAGAPKDSENRSRPLDFVRLRQAFGQLAHGIEALHHSDKLHRDIKPDNILVTSDGTVALLDLGLSRELGPAAVQQSMAIVGTPHYLSPEQGSAGMLSAATDWYSFGVILFEALTGRVPFDGDLAEIVQKKRNGLLVWPPEDSADVPPDLLDLCRDLLEPDPTRRPKGCDVLALLGETSSTMNSSSCGPRTQFVGREGVLDLMTGFFAAVQRTRRPVMVKLRGKSGIGKTTLLPEVERRILQDCSEALVLSGRCHESAKVPFNALDSIFDSLTAYLKRLAGWEIKSLLPRDVACLVKLFPILKQIDAVARQKLSPTDFRDSQDLRNRGFEASIELLARVADHIPLLIQIDDVHWGDQDSATLLGKILSHRSPPSVLIIASYRSEDSDSPFVQAIETMESDTKWAEIVNVDIDELTVAESERLIRSLLASEVQSDTEMISTIVSESGRVPLLITEFANYANLCAKEGIRPVFTINEVIKQRVNRLPSAARKLLQIVAIAGQPVPEVVAHKAAELDADDFPGLQSLAAAHLVRVRESQQGRELEIYHDRYRRSVVNLIDSATKERLHENLAHALREHRVLDYAFIATQFRLSGQHEEAARYYHESAQLAENTFAFDEAAEFYRLSLECGRHPETEQRQLMRLRATALVYGGRGAEAAQIFKEAASAATGLERLDLERCAAEQFLRTGNINEGLRLVQTVGRTLGIKLRDRPWQIILSLLWQRCLIRLRGFRYRLRPIEQVDVRDLAILDTYWSLAVGLSLVDVIRASDFQARHLVAALRTGEPERLALSFGLEAAHSLIPGLRARRWARAEEALKTAEDLGRQYGFRRAVGMAHATRGASNWLVGNWREAQECSIRGEEILRENCRGANWELFTSRMFSLASLMFMGQWHRYCELLPPLLDEARSRGDRYAATGLLLLTYSYTRHLVDDQPLQARGEIDQALRDWSQGGFKLQDFWAFYGMTEVGLYEGHSRAALENVEKIWPLLRRSLLLRIQTIRVYARHLWARCAVAAAAESSGSDLNRSSQLRKQALRLAHKNETESTLPAIAFATSIRAAVTAATGASHASIRQFAKAEDLFAKADMQQYAAACKWSRGHLIGGPEGDALMQSAEEQLVCQGARRPEKLLSMYAPGIVVAYRRGSTRNGSKGHSESENPVGDDSVSIKP